MDSKLLRLLLIGGLALGLNACDSDSDDESDSGTCVTHCEGSFSLQCQPDGSTSAVDCSKAGGCNAATGYCSGSAQPSAVCINNSAKCENNVSWTCQNGQWTMVNSCIYGCSGNSCAEQPQQAVCIAGTKKCENNAAYICGGSSWVKAMDCTNGCNSATKMCNDASISGKACEDESLQCNGAYVQACSNGQWVTAPTPCPNGCENGKCKASSSSEDPVEPPAIDSCDYYDCSDEYLSECGTDGDTAICDTEYIYCVNRMAASDSECGDGETAYEVAYQDGSKQVQCMLVGSSSECLSGGSSEDGCDYETQCTGNTLNLCYDLSWIGWGIIKEDTDCAENGMVCAVIGGEADCHATCTAEGDMGSVCSVDEDYGNEVSTSKSCVKGDDGNLYVAEVQTSCAAACTDGKCDVLDPNEGKECAETDKPYCNGNILVECDSWDGVWAAQDCVYSNNENYTCLPGIESEVECAIPCSASDEGKLLTECEYSDYYGAHVQMNYECTKITDDVYSYQWKSGKYCGAECDADGSKCVKVLDNEGDACDADSFKESCKGDIVSYCGDDGTVTAFNCGLNEASCHVFTVSGSTNGKADCASEENVCTEVGAANSVCTDSLFSSYETHLNCLAADNGKNYWMSSGEKECSGYCDANGVACDDGSSSSGDSCDYYDCSDKYAESCENATNAVCDGEYYYCLSRDTASDSQCGDGESAYSAEDENGSMNTYCLNVGEDASCLSSSSGETVACDDTCQVEGGVLCADYCKNEKGSDVCYMDDMYVYCEDPNA